jgi:hypothetical protein
MGVLTADYLRNAGVRFDLSEVLFDRRNSGIDKGEVEQGDRHMLLTVALHRHHDNISLLSLIWKYKVLLAVSITINYISAEHSVDHVETSNNVQ